MSSGFLFQPAAGTGGSGTTVNPVTFSANTSTTAATTASPFVFTNELEDSDNAYNSSTGQYTIPKTAFYQVTWSVFSNNTAWIASLYVDGVATVQGDSTGTASQLSGGTIYRRFTAGQVLDIRPDVNRTASGGAFANRFCVSEVVGAVFSGATTTPLATFTPTFSTGGFTPVNCNYRIVGDMMDVSVNVVNISLGSGVYQLSVPNARVINTAFCQTSVLTNGVGASQIIGSNLGSSSYRSTGGGAMFYGAGVVVATSATQLSCVFGTAASSAFSANGNAFSDRGAGWGSALAAATLGVCSFNARIPIV